MDRLQRERARYGLNRKTTLILQQLAHKDNKMLGGSLSTEENHSDLIRALRRVRLGPVKPPDSMGSKESNSLKASFLPSSLKKPPKLELFSKKNKSACPDTQKSDTVKLKTDIGQIARLSNILQTSETGKKAIQDGPSGQSPYKQSETNVKEATSPTSILSGHGKITKKVPHHVSWRDDVEISDSRITSTSADTEQRYDAQLSSAIKPKSVSCSDKKDIQQRIKEEPCFKCGIIGHWKNECPGIHHTKCGKKNLRSQTCCNYGKPGNQGNR